MSFSLVQKAHVSSTNSITFPSNVTPGNVVVIGIGLVNTSNEPVVTDGNGFVLETLGLISAGNSRAIFIAVALNSSGGVASYLVRWPAGSTSRDIWAYEFAPSGAGVPVYDVIGTAVSPPIPFTDASVTLNLSSVSELAYAVIAGVSNPTAAVAPWTLGVVGLGGADEYDSNASGSLTTGWTPQRGNNIASALGIKQVVNPGVQYVNSNLATRSASPVSPLTVVSTFNISPGTDCAFAYLVWDATSGTPAVTAVTLGGKSMTACGAAAHDTVGNVFSQIWFLTSPTIAQAQHLVVTFTGTIREIYSNVACFKGVNQTTPVRPGTYQALSAGFTTSFSVTINSNINDITTTCGNMFGTLGTNQALNGINETGVNEMFHDRGAVQGGSVTHTWTSIFGTGATGNFVLAGFSIQSAPIPVNVSHSIDALTTTLPEEGVILSIQVDTRVVRTMREG